MTEDGSWTERQDLQDSFQLEFTVGVEDTIQSAELKEPCYQSLTFNSVTALKATLGSGMKYSNHSQGSLKDLNGQKIVSLCYFIQLMSPSTSMLQMGHETDTPSTQKDNLLFSDWAGVLKQDFAGPSTAQATEASLRQR